MKNHDGKCLEQALLDTMVEVLKELKRIRKILKEGDDEE